MLVRKTYWLVSISVHIKNNVSGLTSKLFYCLTKCLISAEALHNSHFTAALVTLLILTVSNYAQFILFDFLVVSGYVFRKPSLWKLTHSGETLVTRWLYQQSFLLVIELAHLPASNGFPQTHNGRFPLRSEATPCILEPGQNGTAETHNQELSCSDVKIG